MKIIRNNRVAKKLSFLIICLLFGGCEENQKIEYYENGNVYSILVVNKKTGVDTLKKFYENGKIDRIVIFKNGRRNGRYLTFHDNGQVMVEAYYELGKLNGKYLAYNENATLIKDMKYVEGKLDGVPVSAKLYDLHGRLIMEQNSDTTVYY
ncbi:MAG: hypothetical protein IIA45_03485 [Bacteroidetes bacterium]|nr:hypothetical protein [Bacteroidota bacterium]